MIKNSNSRNKFKYKKMYGKKNEINVMFFLKYENCLTNKKFFLKIRKNIHHKKIKTQEINL